MNFKTLCKLASETEVLADFLTIVRTKICKELVNPALQQGISVTV